MRAQTPDCATVTNPQDCQENCAFEFPFELGERASGIAPRPPDSALCCARQYPVPHQYGRRP